MQSTKLRFIPKKEIRYLTSIIKLKIKEIIKEVSIHYHAEILKGNIKTNHVYLLVSLPPDLSVANYIKYIKSISKTLL